jgi:hypothetical protein
MKAAFERPAAARVAAEHETQHIKISRSGMPIGGDVPEPHPPVGKLRRRGTFRPCQGACEPRARRDRQRRAPATRAVLAETQTIPVVFVEMTNSVGYGLSANLPDDILAQIDDALRE